MRSSMEAGPPSGVMHRMSKHLLQAVRIAALLIVATIWSSRVTAQAAVEVVEYFVPALNK